MRKWFAWVAVLAVSITVASCSGSTASSGSAGSDNAGATTGDIRLAYIKPDYSAIIDPKDPSAKTLNERHIQAADAEMRALIDWANAGGGIGGRKIVGTGYTYGQVGTPAGKLAACTKITEDDQQQVVIDDAVFADEGLWPCFVQHKVDYVGLVAQAGDDYLAHNAPYLTTTYPSVERQMKALVSKLKGSGYLESAKVGLVVDDTAIMHAAVASTLLPGLDAIGVKPLRVSWVAGEGNQTQAQVNSAILALKSVGVDHVIIFERATGMLTFEGVAESQQYRPAYAFTDYQAAATVSALYAPPAQNTGAVAVSAIQGPAGIAADDARSVNDSTSPYAPNQITPGFKACLEILGKQIGKDYFNPGVAGASTFQAALCDHFMLWFQAARKVGAKWGPGNLGQGLRQLGQSYQSSVMHATDFSSGRQDGASSFRLGRFDPKCRCFVGEGDWEVVQ